MSETHPNGYRQAASEKRAQAAALNSDADALDAQAELLDPTPKEEVEEESVEEAKPKTKSKGKK